jgi:hypothetical protein
LAASNNAAFIGSADERGVVKHYDRICMAETRVKFCTLLDFVATCGEFRNPIVRRMPFDLNRR